MPDAGRQCAAVRRRRASRRITLLAPRLLLDDVHKRTAERRFSCARSRGFRGLWLECLPAVQYTPRTCICSVDLCATEQRLAIFSPEYPVEILAAIRSHRSDRWQLSCLTKNASGIQGVVRLVDEVVGLRVRSPPGLVPILVQWCNP